MDSKRIYPSQFTNLRIMLKYSLLRFSVVFIPRMPVPLVAPRNFAPTIAERQLARDELSGVQTSAPPMFQLIVAFA